MANAGSVDVQRSVEVRTRPRAPSRSELLCLISLSQALQHMHVTVLPLIYPLALAEFHVSFTLLGAVLGVATAANGLSQGAAGTYRRLSARLVLAGQNLLVAVASMMLAMAPTFAVFGTSRLVAAVVSSPQLPVGNAVLTRHFPDRPGTAIAWHTASGSVGSLVVPLAATAVISRYGWRASLFLLALPIAVGGLLLAVRLGDSRAGESACEPEAEAALRIAILRPSALTIVLAGSVAAGGRGVGVLSSYVPAYLRLGLGLQQVAVCVVLTAVLAGSVIGPILGGHLGDRLGGRRVAIASYVLAAAALALFGTSGLGLPALAAIGALVGIFAYAEAPLLQALFASAVRGASQQAAFGVYFAVSYGSGAIWLALLGATIDHWGFGAAFRLMAVSFLAAGALLFRDLVGYRRFRKRM